MRYMITHSLLSSWLYCMKGNDYGDSTNEAEDPYEEFLKVLRREPTETTEAMQNGIDFEDLITAILDGNEKDKYGVPVVDNSWYEAAKEIADSVRGGSLQFKASRDEVINGENILLYGRLDALRAGEITDIKFSRRYERGKFFDSTQHPMYFEIVPEAVRFTYRVSDGTNVWTESYLREETRDIKVIISDFIDWLKAVGYWDIFAEYWAAK